MAENQGVVKGEPDQAQDEKKTLSWYIKKRSGRKRDYIFDVGKMKVCPHNHLHALSTGGNWYRCEDCNWAFCITQAYVQPLHNLVVGGLLNALHFAKEFGADALQEVLRTPKGQHELDYHLPALPEGKSFWDAVDVMDKVDVTTKDRGAGQLRQKLEEEWVPLAERERRHKELGADSRLGQLLREKGLMAPDDARYADATGKADGHKTLAGKEDDGTHAVGTGAGTERKALPSRNALSGVSRRRQGSRSKVGDSGKS